MTCFQQIAKYVLETHLFLLGLSLYGQNDLTFSYKCQDKVLSPFQAKIFLKSPNNELINLFADTVSRFNFSGKNYCKSKGNYSLLISYTTEKYGKDSIEYDFEISGNELITDITIDFYFKEKLKKKGNYYVDGEKVVNGSVQVKKYYPAPDSIDITLDKGNIGDEFYKGPFFKIKNNSKDTLYGEYLPGYLWGTLSYVKNDSIIFKQHGVIDVMFDDSPPLYPDSLKYATVGSFGLKNKLMPFDYRFEVNLSEKWQLNGLFVYEEKEHIVWWAGTNNYYKLKYDFKIDK